MRGVIAAGSQATAQAGAEMLGRGGNAVDAAVAAAFVSFVAEVGFVHLGGSGVAQVHDPSNGAATVYDFFSAAPGLGGTRTFEELDFREVTVDFGHATQSFHLGRGSVAVPGNVFGLCAMARDYGRLPLQVLLGPALQLARDGYVLDVFQTDTCELLAPLYTNTPGMRAIFAPKGRILQPGQRLFIPHLAETLAELAQSGAEALRRGRLGQSLISDQLANDGAMTEADLLIYRVPRLDPISLKYRCYDILLPPPSSTGGVLTAFALRIMAAFEVSKLHWGSAKHLRLLAETMAATSRARRKWDRWVERKTMAAAVESFLDDRFVAAYIGQVEDAMRRSRPSPAAPEMKGPSNTSHLSVIDSNGLAVSLTTTAGESAGYVVPWTGFIPNNIMGEADLHPHGFYTRPAGQRIHTMMTPLLALEDGQTRLVIGTGGSTRIRSATLQVLSNLIDFRMSLSNSVKRPRVHLEDGVLQCELGNDLGAADELERDGYRVNRWSKSSIYFGGAHSVMRSPQGRLAGVGDARRGGAVAFG